MKFQEIKNKSTGELQSILKELQAKMLQMRFDLAEKRLKDFSQVKKTKVQIARILMLLKAQDK